jgi:hypothetical protein
MLAGCGDAAPAATPTAPAASAPTTLPLPTTAPAATVPAVGAATPTARPPVAAGDEHIYVQHILIGFKGTIPNKDLTRTQEEAKKLAYDLLAQAKGGADFDKLVAENTDDSPPGIYPMANFGVGPVNGEFSREGMVPAFGDVGFSLKPGEIGIADYDPQKSPFGYHIIKRLAAAPTPEPIVGRSISPSSTS